MVCADTKSPKLLNYITAGILIFAGVLRVLPMCAELQYDELWTLINFTALNPLQILTDLSLPNNHPLNTLILKLLAQIGSGALWLRAGVFVCGMLTVYLAGQIAAQLTGNSRAAGWSAMLFTAASAPLILYSATARGYIYQCFGLLICFAGLMQCGKKRPADGSVLKRYYPEIAIIAGSIIAIISVPTGIMFLIPMGIGFLIFAAPERKKAPVIWFTAAAVAVFTLIYYLTVSKALISAQAWGEKLTSFSGWVKFVLDTIPPLLPVPLGIALFLAMIFNRKNAVAFMLSLLPLAAALFTNAGQVRVYLPLALFYAILAACGIAEVCRRNYKGSIPVALMLVISSLVWCYDPRFQPEQPAQVWQQAVTTTPDDVLPVLRGSSGFPLAANLPESVNQFRRRAVMPAKRQLLLLDVPDGVVNGADGSFAEKSFKLGFKGKLHPESGGFLYDLAALSNAPAPGTMILGVFAGNNQEISELQKTLAAMKNALILNIFISNPMLEDFDRRTIRCFVCRYEAQAVFPDNCELYIISGNNGK